MEKIVYNLVKNLLIAKHGYKDKFQNTSDFVHKVEIYKGLNGKEKKAEQTLVFWRDTVTFETNLKDIKLYITSEERAENRPDKVAKRFYKSLVNFI